MSAPSKECLLMMNNVHVSYNDVKALKGVDFDLYKGEIHALVGEHRAGKSTLVKVLSGMVRMNKGEVIYKGRKVNQITPQSAIKQGIGMVYQDFNVLSTLNAVDNIFAGQMLTKRYRGIDYPAMVAKARGLFDQLNISIDTNSPMKDLSTAEQHMVELARVFSYDPDLIVLDEISSKLTPREMEIVYQLLLQAKNKGKGIIYISHNMDEIFQFADRVTILKDGYRKGTEKIKDIDRIKLIKLTYSFVLSRKELEQDNINLYHIKKYNENIIRNLPIGVIILDIENKVYMINYSAVKSLDLYSGEVANQPIERLFKDFSKKLKREMLTRIANKEKHTWKEIGLKKGKYVKISIYPFQDEDYVFLGTIILIEDITQYRFFMDQFLRIEKIASISELAAGVAHEVNNPLGIIQNYIEVLRTLDTEKNVSEIIGKVEKEILRIEETVGNLLSFSKLNKLPDKEVDLGDVINDVLLLLQYKFKEKNINLIKRVIRDEAYVIGDESRLKQVFMNLLLNSFEAVLEEGTIEVDMKTDLKKRTVKVDIQDNGCGISQDISANIFDPFFSTKIGKKNTGLGLAISQHIIDLHQGIIIFSSVPGKSTTFSTKLPLAA